MSKLLKFVLLIVLLVVLVGVGVGYAVPEIEYTVTVDVDRPPQEVWDAFHDPSKTTEWVQGLASVELVEGEPMAVGSRYQMVFDENGEQVVMEEILEIVEAPERFAFKTSHEVMDMNAETTFEANGDGTRIVSHVTMRGNDLVTRAMMPLMKGMIAERQTGDLEALKALVEADG